MKTTIKSPNEFVWENYKANNSTSGYKGIIILTGLAFIAIALLVLFYIYPAQEAYAAKTGCKDSCGFAYLFFGTIEFFLLLGFCGSVFSSHLEILKLKSNKDGIEFKYKFAKDVGSDFSFETQAIAWIDIEKIQDQDDGGSSNWVSIELKKQLISGDRLIIINCSNATEAQMLRKKICDYMA